MNRRGGGCNAKEWRWHRIVQAGMKYGACANTVRAAGINRCFHRCLYPPRGSHTKRKKKRRLHGASSVTTRTGRLSALGAHPIEDFFERKSHASGTHFVGARVIRSLAVAPMGGSRNRTATANFALRHKRQTHGFRYLSHFFPFKLPCAVVQMAQESGSPSKGQR